MQVILNEKIRKELTDILELHKGYFGGEVDYLINAVNGVSCNRFIEKEVREIIGKVESASGVAYNVMTAKTRERNYVIARQYAIYQIYQQLNHLGYTLTEIGKLFNRDHSTVSHSVKQIRAGISCNDYLIKRIHERYNGLAMQSRSVA